MRRFTTLTMFACGVAGGLLGTESDCAAFNEDTHRRIVESASYILSPTGSVGNGYPTKPAGIDQAQ
jgi:hypothetical protein